VVVFTGLVAGGVGLAVVLTGRAPPGGPAPRGDQKAAAVELSALLREWRVNPAAAQEPHKGTPVELTGYVVDEMKFAGGTCLWVSDDPKARPFTNQTVQVWINYDNDALLAKWKRLPKGGAVRSRVLFLWPIFDYLRAEATEVMAP
jgi:hypothetical protein